MALTATSTDFLLLQQKVELLQTFVDWNTVTLLALFTLITGAVIGLQFLTIRQSLERRVQKQLNNKVDVAKSDLNKIIVQYEKKFSEDLQKQEDAFKVEIEELRGIESAHHGRSMGRAAAAAGNFHAASGWYLFAAFWYHRVNSPDDCKSFLNLSLENLKRTSDKKVWESQRGAVEIMLDGLEKDYPKEIDEFKRLTHQVPKPEDA